MSIVVKLAQKVKQHEKSLDEVQEKLKKLEREQNMKVTEKETVNSDLTKDSEIRPSCTNC